MSTKAEQIVEYKAQRTIIKSNLTRFGNFLHSDDPINVGNLKLRLHKAQSLLAEFEEVQTKLELLDTSELESDSRTAFEDKYFSFISEAQEHIDRSFDSKGESSVSTDQSQNQSQITQNLIKLPKVELSSFSGSYDQWVPYSDLFRSMIHENDSLPDIQKFYYLKSTLHGEASKVIESLQVSSSNYQTAWRLLESRYNNERIIVQNHVKALFDIPVIRNESFRELRQLSNAVLTHFRALTALKQPTEHWDALLIHLISTKIDFTTKQEWENSIDSTTPPTFDDLTNFLSRRCQVLEALGSNKQANASHVGPKFQNNLPTKRSAVYASSHISCPICEGNHFIFQCSKFLSKSASWRLSQVKSRNLCINCLKLGHKAINCKSSCCRRCNSLHNTLLHQDSIANTQVQDTNPSTPVQDPNTNTVTATSNLNSNHSHVSSQVILSTVSIIAYDRFNNIHICRALLDSGSQSHFITQEFVNKLNLETKPTSVAVSGINSAGCNINYTSKLRVKSRFNDFQLHLNCLVTPRITNNLPTVSCSRSSFVIPNSIKLADPDFNVSSGIDLLIGAESFYKLLLLGQIKPVNKSQPYWQKTQFGWIASGKISDSDPANVSVSCALSTKSIDENLTRFWRLEEITQNPVLSTEDKYCEDLFKRVVQRNSEGRFIVTLPIKPDAPLLGESRQLAIKRFHNLERKFEKNTNLYAAYSQFIQEYQQLNHMKKINSSPESDASKQEFFLPHHAVFKEDSTTTRLRVVFDGSAKSSNQVSLNDILFSGPVVQQELRYIIARFRLHKFALIADIEKMYRQVLVNPLQTPLQKIVWRDNATNRIETYELTTLTYGTAPAAYLATRCLVYLSEQEQQEYPRGAEIIKRDFYVDDMITGADSIDEVRQIQREVTTILKKGCFNLRKWSSNEPTVLNEIKTDGTSNYIINLDKDSTIKTLGIQWQPIEDIFCFSVPSESYVRKITKRSILSSIAQVFDPLGLINPVIVTAKILMQEIWQCKLSWDESVPVSIYTAWRNYQRDLEQIQKFAIPRRVIECDKPELVEVHGFCDASEKAYGCCVYIRAGSDSTGFSSNLFYAKSRVAPLKATTLPRWELCAAVLLSEVMSNLLKNVLTKYSEAFYWSDSTIALSWIQQPSRTFKTFVANRVSRIQELTTIEKWNHIDSANNPADVVSRGQTACDLADNKLWWTGPKFLTKSKENWPSKFQLSTVIDNLEFKRDTSQAFTSNVEVDEIFKKYSSLIKLQRVTAYCLRFIDNCRSTRTLNIEKRHGPLTANELENSERHLVRMVQAQSFPGELQAFGEKRQVSNTSKLLKLSPFLDYEGIIRVGGRLKHASSLAYTTKHPMLLPANHEYSNLIIQHYHKSQLHAGPQGTLAAIRERYWIISAKNAVRKKIHACIVCNRIRPKSIQHIMGQLPSVRVEPCRPFTNIGVDYAGPFQVREGHRRSKKHIKTYAAVFICLATRAVHIELVHDLTSDSFISALKRFVARRGRVANIYSDNATNFVGANRELQELALIFQEENAAFYDFLSGSNITWHFIPARSPHFGGSWEAAVKSVKHHLKRITFNTDLTYIELYTLLTHIESILNSRPITPMSDDPNDISYLTPGHFLIGGRLDSLPDPSLEHLSVPRLSRWQHVEQLKQHFWTRWSKEYLTHLQQRSKWFKQGHKNLQEHQLVLLKEDNTPSQYWHLGRVQHLHPGIDGVVRAVTVRLSNGSTTRRAVAKLAPLPVNDNSEV